MTQFIAAEIYIYFAGICHLLLLELFLHIPQTTSRGTRGVLSFRIFLTVANELSVWFFFIAGFLFQHLSATAFRTADYLSVKMEKRYHTVYHMVHTCDS